MRVFVAIWNCKFGGDAALGHQRPGLIGSWFSVWWELFCRELWIGSACRCWLGLNDPIIVIGRVLRTSLLRTSESRYPARRSRKFGVWATSWWLRQLGPSNAHNCQSVTFCHICQSVILHAKLRSTGFSLIAILVDTFQRKVQNPKFSENFSTDAVLTHILRAVAYLSAVTCVHALSPRLAANSFQEWPSSTEAVKVVLIFWRFSLWYAPSPSHAQP